MIKYATVIKNSINNKILL